MAGFLDSLKQKGVPADDALAIARRVASSSEVQSAALKAISQLITLGLAPHLAARLIAAAWVSVPPDPHSFNDDVALFTGLARSPMLAKEQRNERFVRLLVYTGTISKGVRDSNAVLAVFPRLKQSLEAEAAFRFYERIALSVEHHGMSGQMAGFFSGLPGLFDEQISRKTYSAAELAELIPSLFDLGVDGPSMSTLIRVVFPQILRGASARKLLPLIQAWSDHFQGGKAVHVFKKLASAMPTLTEAGIGIDEFTLPFGRITEGSQSRIVEMLDAFPAVWKGLRGSLDARDAKRILLSASSIQIVRDLPLVAESLARTDGLSRPQRARLLLAAARNPLLTPDALRFLPRAAEQVGAWTCLSADEKMTLLEEVASRFSRIDERIVDALRRILSGSGMPFSDFRQTYLRPSTDDESGWQKYATTDSWTFIDLAACADRLAVDLHAPATTVETFLRRLWRISAHSIPSGNNIGQLPEALRALAASAAAAAVDPLPCVALLIELMDRHPGDQPFVYAEETVSRIAAMLWDDGTDQATSQRILRAIADTLSFNYLSGTYENLKSLIDLGYRGGALADLVEFIYRGPTYALSFEGYDPAERPAISFSDMLAMVREATIPLDGGLQFTPFASLTLFKVLRDSLGIEFNRMGGSLRELALACRGQPKAFRWAIEAYPTLARLGLKDRDEFLEAMAFLVETQSFDVSAREIHRGTATWLFREGGPDKVVVLPFLARSRWPFDARALEGSLALLGGGKAAAVQLLPVAGRRSSRNIRKALLDATLSGLAPSDLIGQLKAFYDRHPGTDLLVANPYFFEDCALLQTVEGVNFEGAMRLLLRSSTSAPGPLQLAEVHAKLEVVRSLSGGKAISELSEPDLVLLNGIDASRLDTFRAWGLSDAQLRELLEAMRRNWEGISDFSALRTMLSPQAFVRMYTTHYRSWPGVSDFTRVDSPLASILVMKNLAYTTDRIVETLARLNAEFPRNETIIFSDGGQP